MTDLFHVFLHVIYMCFTDMVTLKIIYICMCVHYICAHIYKYIFTHTVLYSYVLCSHRIIVLTAKPERIGKRLLLQAGFCPFDLDKCLSF